MRKSEHDVFVASPPTVPTSTNLLDSSALSPITVTRTIRPVFGPAMFSPGVFSKVYER